MKLLIAHGQLHLTDLVIDCLQSVPRESGSVPDTPVAVCENGTGDNFAERIQRAIDANDSDVWRKLSALPVNLSFTGGNNAIPHCIPELGLGRLARAGEGKLGLKKIYAVGLEMMCPGGVYAWAPKNSQCGHASRLHAEQM